MKKKKVNLHLVDVDVKFLKSIGLRKAKKMNYHVMIVMHKREDIIVY